ncbi:MAG TPA: hypothetical protein VFI27_05760 [candidate division Zixibacteria bacterium]|nr:hypothetical protein [candidate division Zixibacteria bacterium]
MSAKSKSQGLTCPNCSGVVPVAEGVRIVTCPFCSMRSFVQGELGVRRWQITNQIQRSQAMESFKGFFGGLNKAFDLKREAEIKELFLVYLPYWRVNAFVAGWIFGRVKSGKDSTKPVEVEVMEQMEWNDAATDVSEFGVHRVSISHSDLEPYNAEELHAEGMVFEPVESRTEALDEARRHFIYRGHQKKTLKQVFFDKFHLFRKKFSLVYYPLWVGRYEYRNRSYQVVVDGVKGDVLYGKAPGNTFYRAAMLIAGMAIGNFILVNGTVIAGRILAESPDDDSLFILLLPIAVGFGLIFAGYRKFRYGEEVESIQKSARKALLSSGGESKGLLPGGLSILEEMTDINTDIFRKIR